MHLSCLFFFSLNEDTRRKSDNVKHLVVILSVNYDLVLHMLNISSAFDADVEFSRQHTIIYGWWLGHSGSVIRRMNEITLH